MKIKFKKLIIDNFLSFGHAEVDLADKGYTLIEGINQNPKDAAKSNGSGKSTIFSALCFALTGETIQGLSSNLNNIFTKGDMSVDLTFSVDSDEYELIRSRDSKNKADLKVFVNGIDKSGKGVRESQEILNKLLPELTSDLIGEVIIIGQGMPHKFSNNTPSGRKDLLEKLSHSDYMLDDIKARIEKRADVLTDKETKIELEKTRLQTAKELTEKQITAKNEELLKYQNKPNFQDQKETLNKNIKDLEETLETLNNQVNTLDGSLNLVETQLYNSVEQKTKEITDETAVFNENNIKVIREIDSKKSEKKNLCEEIEKLDSIKDVCPLCHQKIPHVHKQDTSEQKKQVKILDKKISELLTRDENQRKAYSLNVKDINERYQQEELNLKRKKIEYKDKLDVFKKQIKEKTSEINNLKISLNNLIKEEEIFDTAKTNCEKELQNLETTKSSLETQLLYNIRKEEEVKNHKDTLTKINTLVKRDFRGVLLSNIINYIDQKCKCYAKDIFGTEELDFKLNGNNLNISYSGKPLEALSGGEQQKVDLILQFAIRAMMQEYTGFSSNIIVLDEILDNLDSVGCDSILDFITNKLSDIESVFIISHHADTLNIGNDSTITVVKNPDGVSYIL